MEQVQCGAVNVKALLREQRDGSRTASALLTYPVRDIDGDLLNPSGVRYADLTPVNWQHGIPVGRGGVSVKSLTIDGRPCSVPVGTTKFFSTSSDLRNIDRNHYPITKSMQKAKVADGVWSERDCLEAAEDVATLVASDIAPGVSVEYLTLKAQPTGHVSSLTKRACMNVDEWALTAWAHCKYPRNSQALTIDQDVISKALHVAETGKVPGTSYKLRSAVILKSFVPVLASQPRRATVTSGYQSNHVGVKAMDDVNDMGAAADMALADEGDAMGDEGAMDGDNTPPTARAAFDAAQGVLDLCDMIDASLKKAEHVKGRTKLSKLCEQLRGYADDLNAVGEMVEKDLGGADDEPEETDEPESEESDSASESDAMPEPVATKAQTGELIVKSGYKPRRFKMSELTDVPSIPNAARSTPADAATLKSLNRELDRLKRQWKQKQRLAALNRD